MIGLLFLKVYFHNLKVLFTKTRQLQFSNFSLMRKSLKLIFD
nr:MAG TPA: hypothetical protein [Caudoviricetes sp.]